MIAMKWYALNQIEATAMTLQPRKKGVSEKKPDLFSHYYDYNITRIPKVFNGALKCSKVF